MSNNQKIGSFMPKVVVIGAGVVGAALADELTARGFTDSLCLTGARCSPPAARPHTLPAWCLQTNPSKTMSAFASYTVEKFCSLEHRDGWVFNQVGGLEVATTPERWPTCTARPAGRRPGGSRAGC